MGKWKGQSLRVASMALLSSSILLFASAPANLAAADPSFASPAGKIGPNADKRVVAYYPDWAIYRGTPYYAADIPTNQVNVIDYAFANIVNGQIAVGDPWSDLQKVVPGDNPNDPFQGNFDALVNMKKQDPKLITMISVGGWTWSSGFSAMAATQASRDTFSNSVVQFLRQYGFDGVDLDWEYPVQGGLVNGTPADKTNYTLLLADLRLKLGLASIQDHKYYYLSIDASPSSTYISDVQPAAIGALTDWINLMTYDIHGSWDAYTGLDSPLYTDPSDPSHFSDSVGVQNYLQQGVPANKINLGIPFYGYQYSGVASAGSNAATPGLWQPYDTSAGVPSINYNVIMAQDYGQNGYVRYWDSAADVPYLYNGTDLITYDDPQSVAAKAQYIDANNLGGAAVWDITADYQDQLLTALTSTLNTAPHPDGK